MEPMNTNPIPTARGHMIRVHPSTLSVERRAMITIAGTVAHGKRKQYYSAGEVRVEMDLATVRTVIEQLQEWVDDEPDH